MKELVAYLVEMLVNNHDDVLIEEEIDEQGTRLSVRLHPEDRGRVIGRYGRTINAIRTLVDVASQGAASRTAVDVVD